MNRNLTHQILYCYILLLMFFSPMTWAVPTTPPVLMPPDLVGLYTELQLAKVNKNVNAEAFFNVEIGKQLHINGEFKKANLSFSKGLELFQRASDIKGILFLGNTYLLIKDTSSARASFHIAKALAEKSKLDIFTIQSLRGLAQSYLQQGDYQKAYESLEDALAFFKDDSLLFEQLEHVNTLGHLAFLCMKSEDLCDAREVHALALSKVKKLGVSGWGKEIEIRMGLAEQQLVRDGLLYEYETRMFELLELSRARRIPLAEADIITRLGNIILTHEDFDLAETYFEDARYIYQSLNIHNREIDLLIQLAKIYLYKGEFTKRKESLEKAYRLAKRVGHHSALIDIYAQQAGHFVRVGEIDLALNKIDAMKAVAEQWGLASAKVNALLWESNFYLTINKPQKALAILNTAVQSFDKSVHLTLKIHAKLLRADLLAALGDPESAEAVYLDVITQKESIDNNTLKRAGTGLVLALRDQSKLTEAIQEQEIIIDTMGLLVTPEDIAYGLGLLAELYNQDGQPEEALSILSEAMILSDSTDSLALQSYVNKVISKCFHSLERDNESVFFAKRAVNLIQKIRAKSSGLSMDLQQSLISGKQQILYSYLADLLLENDRPLEALQVLNAMKSDEYIKFIGPQSSLIDQTSLSLTQTEEKLRSIYQNKQIKDLPSLRQEIPELYELEKIPPKYRTADHLKRFNTLSENFDKAVSWASAYLEQVQESFDEDAKNSNVKFNNAELKTLQSLQHAMAELGDGTVLIHYLTTQEKLHILVSSGDDQFVKTSHIALSELERWVEKFRRKLNRGHILEVKDIASKIYNVLIQPIEKDLENLNAKTLVLSLSGSLRYVPMSALYDSQSKEWLIEKYATVLHTPAANTSLLKKRTPNWKVAGLGVSKAAQIGKQRLSPLPLVPSELNNIVKEEPQDIGVLPGIKYLDDAFDKTALFNALDEDYAVIHIASHFELGDGSDIDPYLLIGGNNKLTLSEISKTEDLNMKGVDLITLSACRTGVGGTDSNGREIEGLGTLLQRKGAGSVLATLWNISDYSSSPFMPVWYELMSNTSINKAQALRQVQLMLITGQTDSTLLQEAFKKGSAMGLEDVTNILGFSHKYKEQPYRHPRYWAPFVLMGNWL